MIGRTDEPLCDEGIREAGELIAPKADVWFTSPMKRCVQTAQILRENAEDPDSPCISVDDLRECDFGHFENRNYIDMSDDEEYQTWIRSGGRMPFPGGEDPVCFQDRCCRAFSRILSACGEKPVQCLSSNEEFHVSRAAGSEIFTVNMVVHGGTIMSIMDRFAAFADGQTRTYFDWAVPNLGGYTLRADEPVPFGGRLEINARGHLPVSPGKRKETE